MFRIVAHRLSALLAVIHFFIATSSIVASICRRFVCIPSYCSSSSPLCWMTAIVDPRFAAVADKDADDIPLLNVKSAVLKKVVEYMRYHAENPPKDIEKPLKSPNMAEVVSQVSKEL